MRRSWLALLVRGLRGFMSSRLRSIPLKAASPRAVRSLRLAIRHKASVEYSLDPLHAVVGRDGTPSHGSLRSWVANTQRQREITVLQLNGCACNMPPRHRPCCGPAR